MQLLINIDETDKQEIDKLLKGRGLLLLDNAQLIKRAVLAVFHGTPLPKGCGRLIILSEDTVKREQILFGFSCQNWISEVGLSTATVAIIEADKTESKD